MSQLTSFLTLAIQAKKDGERGVAQDFLLKVIAAEETNEQAWMHLADVVSDPVDALICLENVATINPKNNFLRMRIASMKRQLGEEVGAGTLGLPRFSESEQFFKDRTSDTAVPALGQFLIDQYGLRRTDVARAMREQEDGRQRGEYKLLGQIMVELGTITDAQVDDAMKLQRRAIDRAFTF